MKSFRVEDGDLDVSSSRRVSMVQGRDKLVQDLTLWLLEPLGIGYTTPAFGSTLNTYSARDGVGRLQGRFVGRPLTERRAAEVEAEVDRILNLYQQNQILKIRAAQIEGRLYLYSRQEVLDSIDSVFGQIDQDRAIIKAAITTGANGDLTFMAQVDNDEASVAIL